MIDLKTIPAYVINLDDAVERRIKVLSLMKSLDIPAIRYPGKLHEQGIIGCGLSHLNLLKDLKAPILVLEDDIEVTDAYTDSLDVPDSTDAVYLGISRHGHVSYGLKGIADAIRYAPISNSFYKIYNMCSTHAILYLTDNYINYCTRTIRQAIIQGIAFDLGLAGIHSLFNVITTKKPFFYQYGQEESTKYYLGADYESARNPGPYTMMEWKC